MVRNQSFCLERRLYSAGKPQSEGYQSFYPWNRVRFKCCNYINKSVEFGLGKLWSKEFDGKDVSIVLLLTVSTSCFVEEWIQQLWWPTGRTGPGSNVWSTTGWKQWGPEKARAVFQDKQVQRKVTFHSTHHERRLHAWIPCISFQVCALHKTIDGRLIDWNHNQKGFAGGEERRKNWPWLWREKTDAVQYFMICGLDTKAAVVVVFLGHVGAEDQCCYWGSAPRCRLCCSCIWRRRPCTRRRCGSCAACGLPTLLARSPINSMKASLFDQGLQQIGNAAIDCVVPTAGGPGTGGGG